MDPVSLFALALLSVSVPMTSAAKLYCSVHPARDAPAASLVSLARVSRHDAAKAALASVKARSKTIAQGDLEVQEGCLVYAFDIQVSGKKDTAEVLVDAGTGIVITHKHETAKREAAERQLTAPRSSLR